MTTIKLKNGSGAPTAGDLVQGEPALDLTNKRLYTEDSGGTVIEVGTNPGTDVTFADNRKAIFGDGSDLQIYHDGSKSYITDVGSGNLDIQGTDIRLLDNTSGGLRYLVASNNSNNPNVSLFYNNGKVFETTSTGIDVTGTVTADGALIESVSDTQLRISDSTSTNQRLDLRTNAGVSKIIAGNNGAYGDLRIQAFDGTSEVNRLRIYPAGDISFYEDTGTTAKFFWDASAESLGIGTSSPQSGLHINTAFGSQLRVQENGGTYWDIASGGRFDLKNAAGTAIFSVAQSGSPIGTALNIDSSNNVGIGTSSPEETLSVMGDFQVALNTSVTGRGLKIHTSNTSITDDTVSINAQASTGILRFQTNSSERMRIDSSGRVGIGTSSPSALLEVATPLSGSAAVFNLLDNTADGFVVKQGSNEYISVDTTNAAEVITLGNTTTIADVIVPAGNVGIGTSSPRGVLDLGSGSGDGTLSNTPSQYQLILEAAQSTTGDIGRNIAFVNSSNNVSAAINSYDAGTGITNGLIFATASSGTLAERMRIDSSGAVIINNSGGDAQLYLGGTSGANRMYLARAGNDSLLWNVDSGVMRFGTNDTERMRIDSSGNVGIGTSAPGSLLELEATGATVFDGTATDGQAADGTTLAIQNLSDTNNTFSQILFRNRNTSKAVSRIASLTDSTGTEMAFVVENNGSPAEVLRIEKTGNVGIGTTSPTSFDAAGDNLVVGTGSGNNGITVYSGTANAGSLFFADGTGSAAAKADGYIQYTHSNQALAFATGGGSEAMRIDSSSNLLVGKTASGGNTAGFEVRSDGDTLIVRDNNRALFLNRKTSDGNILDFAKDGTTVGNIASVGGSDIKVVFSSDGDQYITGNAASNYLTFSSANAERMRLDSSGNLLVGTTSTYSTSKMTLEYSSNTNFGITLRDSGTATTAGHFNFVKGGSVVGTIQSTSSATSYNTSSDQRLKDNIVDAPSASDDIDAIQVRSFDWKADGSHQKYGMVAQELQSVAPEAVSQGETEEDMMGVDYSKLVPMMLKEIQSLRARVAQLEGEN